jgi:hypothetical protein
MHTRLAAMRRWRCVVPALWLLLLLFLLLLLQLLQWVMFTTSLLSL